MTEEKLIKNRFDIQSYLEPFYELLSKINYTKGKFTTLKRFNKTDKKEKISLETELNETMKTIISKMDFLNDNDKKNMFNKLKV